MIKRRILPYLLGLLLISLSLVLILKQDKNQSIIQNINTGKLVISMMITLLIFLFTGLQIAYMTKKQYQTSLKFEDYFVLPIMMHFWSYLVPFRGGLIFSSFYLNKKYKLRLSHGFSIGFYTFIISIILAGFYGLYFSIVNKSVGVFFVSIALILSPLLIFILKIALNKVRVRNKFINKFKSFVENIISNIAKFFNQWKTNFIIIAIILGSITIYILWFYYASCALHLQNTFAQIILVALITRLSVITRIIPGNLGVQELFSGGAMALAGGTLSDGVVISLFIRLSALINCCISRYFRDDRKSKVF